MIEIRRVLAIVGVSVLAAILYGVVHDQVTVRVCLEYFTVGHPPVFATRSPTLLAIGWGVIATWWVGLPLGALLAFAARAGRGPKRSAASLLPAIALLLGVMAGCALVAGLVAFILASRGAIRLPEPLASRVPADRHARFLADYAAHSASYFTGGVGGIFLAARVWLTRRGTDGPRPIGSRIR